MKQFTVPSGITSRHSPKIRTEESCFCPAKTPWQTVLIENRILLRELLVKVLGMDERFEVIAQFDNPAQAKELCQRARPDLVVASAQLQNTAEIDLIEFLVSQVSETRVLVLTEWNDPLTFHRLGEIGVHGILEKDPSLELLEEAMIEVASGRKYHTAKFCLSQERLRKDPKAFSKILSRREQAVLRLVATGATSKKIALELGLSPRTVETYRYRMMKKLGVRHLAGLIDFSLRLRATPEERS